METTDVCVGALYGYYDNGLASRTKIRKSVHVDCKHAHD